LGKKGEGVSSWGYVGEQRSAKESVFDLGQANMQNEQKQNLNSRGIPVCGRGKRRGKKNHWRMIPKA